MPLYAFGSNGSGQLSLSHRDDVYLPEKCFLPENLGPPCQITAGGNHTLALFPSGELYVVGCNSKKQCCLFTTIAYIEKFTPVPPLRDDQSIMSGWGLCAAGWEFSILVSKDGRRVYSCGMGTKGELGLGQGISFSILDIPTIIPNFPPHSSKVTAISASLDHVVAVLDTGEVYGWGNSRKGQLGSTSFAALWQPTKIIEVTFPVAKVACGKEFSFFINDSGSYHLVLGGSKWGLRTDAPPSSDTIKYDRKCELEGYISVGASWGGIYVLLKDRSIKAWGRNDRGQLPPNPLPPVRAMAVGSEHVLAVVDLDDNGSQVEKLIAWGWGEHGNCATFNSSTGRGDDVVAKIHTVPLPHNVALKKSKMLTVGTGCATSWFWLDWN